MMKLVLERERLNIFSLKTLMAFIWIWFDFDLISLFHIFEHIKSFALI